MQPENLQNAPKKNASLAESSVVAETCVSALINTFLPFLCPFFLKVAVFSVRFFLLTGNLKTFSAENNLPIFSRAGRTNSTLGTNEGLCPMNLCGSASKWRLLLNELSRAVCISW